MPNNKNFQNLVEWSNVDNTINFLLFAKKTDKYLALAWN